MARNLESRLARLEAESPQEGAFPLFEDIEETAKWVRMVLQQPDPYEWIARATAEQVRGRLESLPSKPISKEVTARWAETACREAEERVLLERLDVLGECGRS